MSSQTSSVSSCDDYIIVLPDCFDTSRPLDKSTYECATPLREGDAAAAATEAAPEGEEAEWTAAAGEEQERTEEAWPPAVAASGGGGGGSVNQLLCASQTLDTVTLTPQVVPPPGAPLPSETLVSPPALYSPR